MMVLMQYAVRMDGVSAIVGEEELSFRAGSGEVMSDSTSNVPPSTGQTTLTTSQHLPRV